MDQAAQSPRLIRFGVFEADIRSGELRKQGHRLKLREQPFQIMIMLLERPNDVVTREELRQRLWPADTFVDFDKGLNTAVNKLRDALSDSATTPRYIETLPRRGYRYIGPAPVAVDQSESALAPRESEGSPSAHPSRLRSVVRALFALAQLMYLIFYIVALMHMDEVFASASVLIPGSGRAVWATVVTSAAIGIPIRLYLLAAVAFDYQPLGRKFFILFPLLFALDWMWALAPFLIAHKIGNGLAIAACCGLLYLPFSARTLIRMGYANRNAQPPSSPLAGL